MLLEIACFDLEDALIAQEAGADRLEFCEDYRAGGLTPSYANIQRARNEIKIPLCIMIRPRGGNFMYSDAEFALMKEQILFCKKIKCDGLVFGILTEQNTINIDQCRELILLAKPLSCTFHRAFDAVRDLHKGLEDAIGSGFTRILTSGGNGPAIENADRLKQLVQQAAGRIIIMPGGGVRSSTISELVSLSGACEVHSAALDKTSLKMERLQVVQMKNLIA